MRLTAAAACALTGLLFPALLSPGLALAAPIASSLAAPAAQAASPAAASPEDGAGNVRIAMHRETLPAHGKMAEHRPTGERYLYVLSGRLKVSDLVTGDEQIVEAGKMAAEQAGDWHVAEAMGADPATVYVIDRTPVPAPATASLPARGGGN